MTVPLSSPSYGLESGGKLPLKFHTRVARCASEKMFHVFVSFSSIQVSTAVEEEEQEGERGKCELWEGKKKKKEGEEAFSLQGNSSSQLYAWTAYLNIHPVTTLHQLCFLCNCCWRSAAVLSLSLPLHEERKSARSTCIIIACDSDIILPGDWLDRWYNSKCDHVTWLSVCWKLPWKFLFNSSRKYLIFLSLCAFTLPLPVCSSFFWFLRFFSPSSYQMNVRYTQVEQVLPETTVAGNFSLYFFRVSCMLMHHTCIHRCIYIHWNQLHYVNGRETGTIWVNWSYKTMKHKIQTSINCTQYG